MKNVKIALAAIAIFTSISLAFAFKPAETKTATQAGTVLYWFTPSLSAYMGANTVEDEQSETGCIYSGSECERGYDATQLNNSSNPSLGVKPGEVNNPQVIIRHQD